MKKTTFTESISENRLLRSFRLSSALALVMMASNANATQSQHIHQYEPKQKPNVIYILVDDLGYGDIEPFGQRKTKTPNLQKMANEGLMLTQHYAGNPVCAPSRAALITGKHSGHGQIRGNYELGGYSDATEFGQMPLTPGTATIGKVMQGAGYKTALIGKWGLGGPGSYGVPTKQGFDYFFGYLDQKQAHNHYPTHLWKNEEKFPLNNTWVNPHAKFPKHADPLDESAYEQFKRPDFAQERLTNEALNYIEINKNERFFLYLSYAAPHAALQAPDEEIAKYKHFKDTPYDGKTEGGYLPQFRPRAARAAMISHIDQGIGQVFTKLSKLGLDENTVVIFSSDNGPSPEGGADMEFFDSNGNNRGYKRDLYEGGIRMPTIVRWPNKVKAGSTSEHVSAFWDLMPTLADIAGTKAPKNIDGISFLPTLLDQGKQEKHDNLYWEFHHWNGSHLQAVRIVDEQNGDWKVVKIFAAKQKSAAKIEVYNLKSDPLEMNNVAKQNPKIVAQAKKLFKTSRKRSFMDSWNFDFYQGKK
ncbi:arylsulfatase [Thalassotalea sp. ND16A]|uniref:arylsulfatase n=1 Tax=Thalassotalea sp. ND16A TaxID=1535422 RepID=UPI00051E048D|nr:arylsulfatase [Thalassotalea sp. ND16A]KGK00104.1 Steryl-sulfatase [Thalassotalea sp. ND16A]